MLVCARFGVGSRIGYSHTVIQGPFSLAAQAAGLPNSGADGSIIVYPEELSRDLNNGLQTIAGLLAPLPEQFNVSAGDVVHVRP